MADRPKSSVGTASFSVFLGGNDLEMQEIAELVCDAGFAGQLVNKRLAWGAKASAYLSEIRSALAAGETPVLIELTYDLPADIDRARLLEIDHHGGRAGIDQPSSLRQVFDLVLAAGAAVAWTRRRALVQANDIGHARGMRMIGASAAEIRAIRDDDRAAQGITAEIEATSRRAIDAARRHGALLIVETEAPTASAIMDFLLPEYGGPADQGANTLVIMPQTVAFFGTGTVIAALKTMPDCWFGGALPETGFWGAPRSRIGSLSAFEARVGTLVNEAGPEAI